MCIVWVGVGVGVCVHLWECVFTAFFGGGY